jgi:hypothetical protein
VGRDRSAVTCGVGAVQSEMQLTWRKGGPAEEAYSTKNRNDVVLGKMKRNLVPEFPKRAPHAFTSLSELCWAANPYDR